MGSDLKYIYLEINGSDLKLPVEMSLDGSCAAACQIYYRSCNKSKKCCQFPLTMNKQIASTVGLLSHDIESC